MGIHGQQIIMQYAQYLVVFVCLSVCLPTLILALQATRCNMSGTSSFRATYEDMKVINPRCACAAKVTVVGFVCLSVCLSVCLLLYISPLERLFVPETLPSTQRATKVRKFVGFSLKVLRCKAGALPALYG